MNADYWDVIVDRINGVDRIKRNQKKYLIRLPKAATFKLPSRKRGWGCVTENLHTPLSPLFRGEIIGLKFLNIKLGWVFKRQKSNDFAL